MIIYGCPEMDEGIRLSDYGIHTVITGNTSVVPRLKEEGYRVYLACGAFSLGSNRGDESFHARDINGSPQVWFGSGCPNDKRLISSSLEKVSKLCETPDIEGIIIDGARFSSLCSGPRNSFYTCFCGNCEREAERLSFDFEKMKRGAKSLYDKAPDKDAIEEWLRFRSACVTGYLGEFSRIVRSRGLEAGAFLFSPSIAPLVGQNYRDLSPLLDIVSPMVYRAYKQKEGPACLNHELAAAADEFNFVSLRELSDLFGVDLTVFCSPADILSGLSTETAVSECERARDLSTDSRAMPILDLNDSEIKSIISMLRERDFKEISLFLYNKDYISNLL